MSELKPEQFQQETIDNPEKINDVVALSQLVTVIVDYYAFKNQVEEDEEGDEWKKKVSSNNESSIIPSKLDTIIEKAFTTQLKRFTVQNGVS
jgi:hypothetical protein